MYMLGCVCEMNTEGECRWYDAECRSPSQIEMQRRFVKPGRQQRDSSEIPSSETRGSEGLGCAGLL